MKRTIIPVIACIVLTACSTPGIVKQKYSSSVYQGGQMQQSQSVVRATIVSIREITIQEKPNIMGSSVGAGLGALMVLGLAGTGGNPYGLAAGAIAAGMGGGMLTDYVEKQLNTTSGYEFTLKFTNGQTMTVAQSNIDMMTLGDKVYVSRSSDGVFRVYK